MSAWVSARLSPRGTREQHHEVRSKQNDLQPRQADEEPHDAESEDGHQGYAEPGTRLVESEQPRQLQRHGVRRRERLHQAVERNNGRGGRESVPPSPDLPASDATVDHLTSFLALQSTPLNTSRSSNVRSCDTTPDAHASAAHINPDPRHVEDGHAEDHPTDTDVSAEEKGMKDEGEEGYDASFEEQLSVLAQQISELSARLEQKERESQRRQTPLPCDNFDLTAGAAATRLLPLQTLRSDADVEPRRRAWQQQQVVDAAAQAGVGGGGVGVPLSWMEPQHPTVQWVFTRYNETQQLLVEERRRRFALRAQYEKHLALLRKRTEQEKLEIKRQLLTQVDFLIRKYRRLAGEAVAAAKRERARVDHERQAARKLAESACKNFEADLKERTKTALEQYRVLAQQAQKVAQEEREQLTQKYTELEQSVNEERRQYDALIVQEAEERVATMREAYGRLKQQLEDERYRYSQLMIEVQKKVELECELYEEALVKGVTQLLLEKGVSDMEEAAVRSYLTSYREEQLRDGRSASHPGRADKAVTVRYGFQALNPEGLQL